MEGGEVTTTTLYVPPDADEAYRAWKSTCGPAACAAILGRPIMSLREAFSPYKGYTPFASMKRALERLDIEHATLRKCFKLRGVYLRWDWTGHLSIIQWHGSWMNLGVHPGAALTRTHWVAFDNASKLVYDVNAGPTGDGGWVTLDEWQDIAKRIMAEVRGCDGTYSTRSTILVKRPS
jgi:hypothetical protein